MNLKKASMVGIGVMVALGAAPNAKADLPADFPSISVTTPATSAVGDGYIFLEVTDAAPGGGYYLMMLNNDGTPFWYKQIPEHNYDFKVLPNGLLHYAEFYHTHSWTGGGDVNHRILDNNYNAKESIVAGNGYNADAHDFQMLPNGHVLLQSYYRTQMDISKYVVGAYPNALVAGAVIQELDAERNVIFQWRSWDHFTVQSYYGALLNQNPAMGKRPVIDAFHFNTVVMDTDGNLLVSNFGMDVWKINRQTGNVMWRLGGPGNQFSFVGETPQQALPHFSGHSVSRLENGNIMIYCNADQAATRSSAVYEYQLNEVTKVATRVWSYTPATPCYAWHYGSAQRLSNGNTFIGWGGGNVMPGVGGVVDREVPACTEVKPDGTVVFEMKFNDVRVASYRAYRMPYPPATKAKTDIQTSLTTGGPYVFAGTGVSLDVSSGGGGYNEVTVTSEPYAPVDPRFNEKAPRVLPQRVKMTASSIGSLSAIISFDPTTFGMTNPGNLTVYHREQIGQGLFVGQPTEYNFGSGKLEATVAMSLQSGQLGEFIFGYPDVTEVPYPPTLAAAENYRGVQNSEFIGQLPASPGMNYSVNQTLPICLAWSPNGFAGSYQVQIATSTDFTAPVVDKSDLTAAFYVFNDGTPGNVAAPGTTYYYRVLTTNAGGTSTWVGGSFHTVAPMLALAAPNGMEGWRRGLQYFVQWQGNTPEPVVIDLYKGGVFLMELAPSVPNTGAWQWKIPLSLVPGNDYSILVRTAGASPLSSSSAATFGADVPYINPGSLLQLADGRAQFSLTAPGASQAKVQGSTDLIDWQDLQTLSVTNGSATFTDTAPQLPSRFYRLYIAP